MADGLAAALVRELAAALPEPLSSELVDAIARAMVQLGREADRADRAGEPELLTVAEVAARLRVNPKWVYAHQHELGPIRLGDGPRARLRFDAAVVAARIAPQPMTGDGEPSPPLDEGVRPEPPRRTRRRLTSRPLPPNRAASRA